MAGDEEEETHRRADRARERQDRMGGAAREQSASPLAAKPRARQDSRGQERRDAEAREKQRVAGEMGGPEDLGDQVVRAAKERADEPAVGARV